jgi:hypothetical protein
MLSAVRSLLVTLDPLFDPSGSPRCLLRRNKAGEPYAVAMVDGSGRTCVVSKAAITLVPGLAGVTPEAQATVVIPGLMSKAQVRGEVERTSNTLQERDVPRLRRVEFLTRESLWTPAYAFPSEGSVRRVCFRPIPGERLYPTRVDRVRERVDA